MKQRDRENRTTGVRDRSSPHSLQPILKKRPKADNSFSEAIDTDLFNSLLRDGRKDRDNHNDSEDKENERPNIPKLKRNTKNEVSNNDKDRERIRSLEEDLFTERHKVYLLDQEVRTLMEDAENIKNEYRGNLEVFSAQIRNFKALQSELIERKKEMTEKAVDMEELKMEVARYKEATRAAIEFIIKSFEIVTLLPDQVEVDARSHDMMEFSFEEKKVAYVSKSSFLETRIMKFLEANDKFVTNLELEGLLFKIIEEWEKKKIQGNNYNHKLTNSPSKHKRKGRGGSKSQNRRSGKKVEETCQESICEYGDKNNNSLNKSVQSSSGGKNNNYSININLVVNDNSDSAISDQNNTSGQVSTGQNFQNFIKFFEKELGCTKNNRSENSIVAGDSLLYSPSDKGTRNHDTRKSDTQEVSAFCSNSRVQDFESEIPAPEIVTAIYDYQQTKEGDISIYKGDKLKVIQKEPSGWWIGQNMSTGLVGYFPMNFALKL